MQQIKQTAEAALSALGTESEKSDNKTSRKTGLPLHWVSAIFEKFDVLYPHKWAAGISGREELAINEWSKVLDGLTGNDIKRGFDNWKGEWPPSAMEFLAVCRTGTKAYHRPRVNQSHRLSSDEREKQRESFKNNLHALALSLKKQNTDEDNIQMKIIEQDLIDFEFMRDLARMAEERPNIIERINIIKSGSF